jgi:hypothetical protein
MGEGDRCFMKFEKGDRYFIENPIPKLSEFAQSCTQIEWFQV